MDDSKLYTLQTIYDMWMFIIPCVTELDDYYNFTRAASGLKLCNFVDSTEVKFAKQQIANKKRMDEATDLFLQIIDKISWLYADDSLDTSIEIEDDLIRRFTELTGFQFGVEDNFVYMLYSSAYRDINTRKIETYTVKSYLLYLKGSTHTFKVDSIGRVVYYLSDPGGLTYSYYVTLSDALRGI